MALQQLHRAAPESPGQLQALQTYYVRAYATSAVGTQYSSQTITLNTVGDAPTTGDNPPLFVRK